MAHRHDRGAVRALGVLLTTVLALVGLAPVAAAAPAAVTAAATAAAVATPNLVDVEPGTHLGSNGRYHYYRDPDVTPWNWASPRCSATAAEGAYVRLVSACTTGRLVTELLDPVRMTVLDRREVATDRLLPAVGGVAVLGGAVYVVSGQENLDKQDATEVVRVSRFTTALAHVGSAGVRAGAVYPGDTGIGGVTKPFDAGSVGLALVGTTLLVHTAREMYSGHQGNLTLRVDTRTMSALEQVSPAYSSHSFNQLAATAGDKAVLVDHGDAYPREIFLTVVDAAGKHVRRTTLLTLQGAVGANSTAATANSLAVTGSTAAVVGLSAPQEHLVRGVSGQPTNAAGQVTSNVYLALVDTTTGALTYVWLTDNHPVTSTTNVGQPTVTTLPSGDLAVMFHTTRTSGTVVDRDLQVIVVSRTGVVRSRTTVPGTALVPSSEPVVVGTRLVWVGIPQRSVGGFAMEKRTDNVLQGLDLSVPTAPRLLTGPSFEGATAPTVAGTATVGSRLTASVGTWRPAATGHLYQWRLDGAPVAGATGASWTLPASAAGHDVDVVVTGTRTGTMPLAATSRAVRVAHRQTAAARLTGTAAVGRKLTATAPVTTPAALSTTYRWYRGSAAISGATKRTYTAVAADAGKRLTVRVTTTRATREGTASETVALTSAAVLRVFTKKPAAKVSGTAKVGQRLTATARAWTPRATSVSYRWLRDGTAIPGATKRTYTVVAADRGKKITVRVTGRRAGRVTASATSAARTVPLARFSTNLRVTTKGSAKVGGRLTATASTMRPAATRVTYRWYRSGKAIPGATGRTYTLRAADEGRKIRVRVTVRRAGHVTVSRTVTAATKVARR